MSFLFAPTTNTSTNQSQQQQQGSSSGTSTSSAALTPQLQSLADSLMSFGSQSMTNPTALFKPIENAGLQSINQTYAQAPNTVMRQMAARGYGSSGTAGDAMYAANLQRAGAVSNFEGGMAQAGVNQMNQGASLSENLLNSLKGTTTTANGTTSSSGSSSGTQTTPGPSIFSSLAGLFGTVLGLGTGGGSTLKGATSSGPSTVGTTYGTPGGLQDFGNTDWGG